jgi:gliding motility-associated-like protein
MKVTLAIVLALLSFSSGLTQIVGTFAGIRDSVGFQDGPSQTATFNNPHGIAISPLGNIFICDRFNHIIRKITPQGVVITLAGNPGNLGDIDGQGSAARFYEPWGLCVDAQENVYVADTRNNKIRKITPDGIVSTYAGTGNYGTTDGPYNASTFGQPVGIEIDHDGNIYVADHSTHIIRKIDPDQNVVTLAGSPFLSGDQDGIGTNARFNRPYGLTLDINGDILLADEWNHKIKRITPDGEVSTIAGTGEIGNIDSTLTTSTFQYPWDVAVDPDGRVYIADGLNYTIRLLQPGSTPEVITLAGQAGTLGSNDGIGTDARFVSTTGITFSPLTGELYVADAYNNLIRRVTDPSNGLLLTAGIGVQNTCPEDAVRIDVYPSIYGNYEFYLDDTLVKSGPENWLDTVGLSSGLRNFRAQSSFSNQAIGSDTLVLEVFEVQPATIDTVGETTFFEGDSVILISSFGEEYFWSNGEITPTLKVFDSGIYNVEVTDANACISQSPAVYITVIEELDPILILYEGPVTFCEGESLWLQTNYPSNVQWIKDGWPIDGATALQYEVKESGVYQIQHTSENGITILSDPLTLTFDPFPDLDFRAEPRTAKPGTAINFINLTEDLISMTWDFGDGSSANISDTNAISHSYDLEGDFSILLIGTTPEGCIDSLLKEGYIKIEENVITPDNEDDVFIPTAFTPNGDGNNDILFVRGTDIAIMDFRVVNQWGEILFESRSQERGWDGSYQGKAVPAGNYHYLLTYTNLLGSERVIRGMFTLLK